MLCALMTHIDKSPKGLTSNEVAIVLDSGANVSLSNSKDDFISKIYLVRDCEIKGITSSLSIEGISLLEYSALNNTGNHFIACIKNALYVPDSPVQLICPQQMIDQTNSSKDDLLIRGKGLDIQ